MLTTLDGIRLNYECFGNGDEPLLMVHGWNGRLESLKPLAEKLAENFKIYLIDLPGFGNSSLPPEDWSADEYVKIIHQFILHHKIGSLTVLGHSFGGGLGVKLAIEYPALVKRLILISAAVRRSPVESRPVSLIKKIFPFYDTVKEKAVMPRRIYYKVMHPRSDALKRPELEKIYRRIIREDLTPVLRKVNCDTLIIWGGKDLDTPLSDGHLLKSEIEGSKLVVHDEYSHNLPIVAPELVAEDIKRFILDKE